MFYFVLYTSQIESFCRCLKTFERNLSSFASKISILFFQRRWNVVPTIKEIANNVSLCNDFVLLFSSRLRSATRTCALCTQIRNPNKRRNRKNRYNCMYKNVRKIAECMQHSKYNRLYNFESVHSDMHVLYECSLFTRTTKERIRRLGSKTKCVKRKVKDK